MAEIWVVNASPLILLARIGQLAWLEQLAQVVWVPATVIREVEAGKDKDSSANVAIDWVHRAVSPISYYRGAYRFGISIRANRKLLLMPSL